MAAVPPGTTATNNCLLCLNFCLPPVLNVVNSLQSMINTLKLVCFFVSVYSLHVVEGFLRPANTRLVDFRLNMVSPKPTRFPNTREGKAVVIARTNKMLEGIVSIITLPIQGVSMELTDMLKKELPSDVVASVVKNGLMRTCVKETQFNPLTTAKGENMYIFIRDGQMKDTYDAIKRWQKEAKRTEPQDDPKNIVLEEKLFSGTTDIEDIVSIPAKKELMAQLARAINGVATKLGRAIDAIANSKDTGATVAGDATSAAAEVVAEPTVDKEMALHASDNGK